MKKKEREKREKEEKEWGKERTKDSELHGARKEPSRGGKREEKEGKKERTTESRLHAAQSGAIKGRKKGEEGDCKRRKGRGRGKERGHGAVPLTSVRQHDENGKWSSSGFCRPEVEDDGEENIFAVYQRNEVRRR